MTAEKKYPIPSAEQEDLEEALGTIWSERESGVREEAKILAAVEAAVGPAAIARLRERKLIREPGSRELLTEEGDRLAQDITRRHRLAERLLSDVLALHGQSLDPNACQLEHILSDEVTESICTLLGHPAECPHGLPIPRGECCRRAEDTVEPIIASLEDMSPGTRGRIAYLSLNHHPDLHKLLSLGLVPGTPFKLHQTFPTYVLEVGETTLAVEKEIAEKIFIRRID